MKPIRAVILFLLLLIILDFVYLYPGSEALLSGRTDAVMSDGTDISSLPFLHDAIVQVFREHPSRFFYGSIYIDHTNPDRGTGEWIPWNERWIVLFHSLFFPVEQLSAAFTATILILNGLAMFLLCAYIGWSPWVGSAMGVAWAFNAYTRARAKVHPALAGIYHVPLIFLGLYLVARGKGWRSLLAAVVAFLVAGTVAHYYLITTLFLSPFFLLFLALQPEFKKRRFMIFQRLAIAVTPLLIFLAWNFIFAVPSDAKVGAVETMNFRNFKDGQNDPFLDVFYAHPIDFLAGDIALEPRTYDWNFLRSLIGDSILEDRDLANSHERTNGIRWILLLLAGCGIAHLARKTPKKDSGSKPELAFFLVFGLFAFWQASGPNFPTHELNPSFWLYSLCSKIRVTNRAGIFVHFSVIMLAGLFLATNFKWKKYVLLPGVLIAAMVVDYLPLQGMPLAPVQPAYAELQRDRGACGVGMAFPFFNSFIAMGAQYVFTQRLRGSDCPTLNQLQDIPKLDALTRAFPPAIEFINNLKGNADVARKLVTLSRCVPLNWIAFHEITPREFADDVCRQLGWTFYPDGICLAPDKNQPKVQSPELCL